MRNTKTAAINKIHVEAIKNEGGKITTSWFQVFIAKANERRAKAVKIIANIFIFPFMVLSRIEAIYGFPVFK